MLFDLLPRITVWFVRSCYTLTEVCLLRQSSFLMLFGAQFHWYSCEDIQIDSIGIFQQSGSTFRAVYLIASLRLFLPLIDSPHFASPCRRFIKWFLGDSSLIANE